MNKNITKYTAAAYLSALIIFTGCAGKQENKEAEKSYCISKELKKILNWPKAELLPIEESITLTGSGKQF